MDNNFRDEMIKEFGKVTGLQESTMHAVVTLQDSVDKQWSKIDNLNERVSVVETKQDHFKDIKDKVSNYGIQIAGLETKWKLLMIIGPFVGGILAGVINTIIGGIVP